MALSRTRLSLDRLEDRAVPDATAVPDFTRSHPPGVATPDGSPAPVGLTPAQVRGAYGFDGLTFGTVVGDGAGQTIAIVDAYDNPAFVSSTSPSFLSSDLHLFDAAFGLPDPVFTKVNQTGGTTYPAGNTGWGTEIALDVEWAHAVAPRANILLVEAKSNSYADLFAAVNYAKGQPGVSVVSMSFGGGEFSGETTYDSTFTTPAGHAGVTFVASTGDSGAPGSYPAYSPRVLAVGGTRLTVAAGNTYGGESGWSGSGGGVSTTEAKPAYQSAVTLGARRMTPDVAFDADPNSGVAVYDSYSQGAAAPWIAVGGTSLAAPMWAGLVALADQGRALAGQGSLDGYSQTLPKLYSLPAADFHDVTTGNNGYAAGPGYDLVTGLGTPVVGLVANGLIDATSPPPPASPPPPPALPPPPPATTTTDYGVSGLSLPIRDLKTTTSSVTVPADVVITKLTVTVNLTHNYDSDLVIQLVSPGGTVVTLSNRHGGSGDNYTNTVFDSTATRSVAAGAAPFTGTYAPDGSLAGFNTLDAKGTWQLRVYDAARGASGALKGWTLTVQGTPGAAAPAAVVVGTHPAADASPAAVVPPVGRAAPAAVAAAGSVVPAAAAPFLPPQATAPAAGAPAGEPVASHPAPAGGAVVTPPAPAGAATATAPTPAAVSFPAGHGPADPFELPGLPFAVHVG